MAFLIGDRVEFNAGREIPFKSLFQFFGQPLAVKHRVELVVNAEAADIDICRADRADLGRELVLRVSRWYCPL